MKIDDTEVPDAVIGCWKDLLDKSGDADLAALCKQHKALCAGFRPGKAPDRGVAPRAQANSGGVPYNDQTLREQLTLGVEVDAYGCRLHLVDYAHWCRTDVLLDPERSTLNSELSKS